MLGKGLLCRALVVAIGLLALPAAPADAAGEKAGAAERAYRDGDFHEAARLWGEACDHNDAASCYELGIVYRDGEGTPADHPRYLKLMRTACDGDEPRGCYQLGREELGQQEDGGPRATPEQRERGLAFYGKACDLGLSAACRNLSLHMGEDGALEHDPQAYVARLEQSCATGDGAGCFALAALYDRHEGKVLRDNPAAANDALRRGCSRLDRDSCQNLAWHYAHGFGVKTDLRKSAVLYQLACDDDAGFNCPFIPATHIRPAPYSGSAVANEWRAAAGTYEQACHADFAPGCFGLARLIARSGKGAEHADQMRSLLEKAIRLEPDFVIAWELLRRVDAGELPDAKVS
ncbi:MAG: sel1 repeat family protein [Sphingomonadales bacterium]|nr:sel1 repeat family protein [Sphingomonadales bacterium]MBD3772263.1 sel1 repeat family protein [Paracoccaceae bacterium]